MPKFIGNAEHLLHNKQFMSDVINVAESSYNNINNDLVYEQIYHRTLNGLLCEQIIIDSNSLYTKHTDDFVHDIDAPMLRIEVKSSSNDNSWWNIRETTYYGTPVPVIKYFLDNARAGNIDLLYYVYIDKRYDVYLKFVVIANKVEQYLRKSGFGKPGWYFDHFAASSNGHCKIY